MPLHKDTEKEKDISSSRHPTGAGSKVSKTFVVIFHLYLKIINHATKIPFNTTSKKPNTNQALLPSSYCLL